MKQEVFSCDECGSQRGKANHWWIGVPFAGTCFTVHRWSKLDELNERAEIIHLCSEGCVMKRLSKWMGSPQSANAVKPQPVETTERSANT